MSCSGSFIAKLCCAVVIVTSGFLGQILTAQETAQIQDATKIHRQYKAVDGEAHVDFILPSIESGEFIQLSKYRGQKVLLLHFASW